MSSKTTSGCEIDPLRRTDLQLSFTAERVLHLVLPGGLSTGGRRVGYHDHDAPRRWATRAAMDFVFFRIPARIPSASSSPGCCAGDGCCTSPCDTCRRPPD